jgi:hypothetical protein
MQRLDGGQWAFTGFQTTIDGAQVKHGTSKTKYMLRIPSRFDRRKPDGSRIEILRVEIGSALDRHHRAVSGISKFLGAGSLEKGYERTSLAARASLLKGSCYRPELR